MSPSFPDIGRPPQHWTYERAAYSRQLTARGVQWHIRLLSSSSSPKSICAPEHSSSVELPTSRGDAPPAGVRKLSVKFRVVGRVIGCGVDWFVRAGPMNETKEDVQVVCLLLAQMARDARLCNLGCDLVVVRTISNLLRGCFMCSWHSNVKKPEKPSCAPLW